MKNGGNTIHGLEGTVMTITSSMYMKLKGQDNNNSYPLDYNLWINMSIHTSHHQRVGYTTCDLCKILMIFTDKPGTNTPTKLQEQFSETQH